MVKKMRFSYYIDHEGEIRSDLSSRPSNYAITPEHLSYVYNLLEVSGRDPVADAQSALSGIPVVIGHWKDNDFVIRRNQFDWIPKNSPRLAVSRS